MPGGYPRGVLRARSAGVSGSPVPASPGAPLTAPRGGTDDRAVLPVAVRHRVASFVLATLVPLALDGCVSVGLSRAPAAAGDAGTGEVAVSVYRKSAERKAGATVSFPVLSELERLDGASRTTVARSMAGSFTLPRVPPGRYALRVARKIDEHGDVVPLRQPASKEFDVRAGERVEASVLLEKVPVGWIVLAAVTVVLLVVLAVELADDVPLPEPPPLPAPELFLRVALAFPFGAATGPEGLEPGVADVWPAPGSVVAARRVSVSFLVSTPLDPSEVEPGAVLAIGSLSGEIPGAVSWSPEDQLLRFVPSRDFRSGEDVTVTLDLGKVESERGRSGSGRATTRFRVP